MWLSHQSARQGKGLFITAGSPGGHIYGSPNVQWVEVGGGGSLVNPNSVRVGASLKEIIPDQMMTAILGFRFCYCIADDISSSLLLYHNVRL